MNQYGGAPKVCDEGNFKVSGGAVFSRYRVTEPAREPAGSLARGQRWIGKGCCSALA